VRLDVLPGVAQPGSRPAAAPADPLFVATVRPVSPGDDLGLQRRGTGGWETVARAPQDAAGKARFLEALHAGEAGGTFRAVTLAADGSPGTASNEVEGLTWTPVFADDFDGTSLDTSKWGYRSPGVYNFEDDGRCSTSDPSAVRVLNGTVRLQVRRDEDRLGEECRTPEDGTHDYYLNGRIDTEGTFSFTYGVAAARVKFQRGRGQHGAFWMQSAEAPVPGDPAAGGSEVDVAEFFGQGSPKGGMGMYTYYTGARGKTVKVGEIQQEATAQLPPGDSWWDRFHVFSVEWTPDVYIYRVDGREIFRNTQGVSGVEEFLLLSLSTKDWELSELDPSLLPSTMQVDWVRVWQDSGA